MDGDVAVEDAEEPAWEDLLPPDDALLGDEPPWLPERWRFRASLALALSNQI